MFLTSFCTFAHLQIFIPFQGILRKTIQNQISEKEGGIKWREESFSREGMVSKKKKNFK